MDSMQKYLEYEFYSLCGIPELRIMGEKNDWIAIKNKLAIFNQKIPGLSVWYNQISSIVQRFVDVYEGKIDNLFWDQIYKG